MADERSGAGAQLTRALDAMRERLWLWPTVAGVLAFVAAEALVRVDRVLDTENARPLWVFSGDAGAARSVLSTIATATMSVLGVTLTITLAVLALTAQGYSPRVLRRFVRDLLVQTVIAGFTASFVFSLVALRLVREDVVPGLTVNVAAALAFVVVALLIAFFHHLANEIRVERLIESVWDETRAALERVHPDAVGDGPAPHPDAAPAGTPAAEVRALRSGRVRRVDEAALVELAAARAATLVVVPRPGDFVAEGEVTVRVHADPPPSADEQSRIAAAVHLGTQRTMTQDAAFGIRQLADIGLRALSPSVNDPTTAAEAIVRMTDLLRRLAGRRLGPRTVARGAGRVIRAGASWEDLVGLAVDQIAAEAEAQADAATSLALLDALRRVAAAVDDPARLEVVRVRARRIRDGARRAISEPTELARIEAAAAPLA